MWALVPIKSHALAKQRLARVLNPAQRSALVQAMASDLLVALGQVEQLSGRIAIVGSDRFASSLAEKFNFRLLSETGDMGLNKALEFARTILVSDGADELMVIHADLPLARPETISRFLDGHAAMTPPAVSLISDRPLRGTNCVAMSPTDALPMLFGGRSLERFSQAAKDRRIQLNIHSAQELQFDLDEPCDLVDFLAYLKQHGGNSASYCKELVRSGSLEHASNRVVF